MRAKREILTMQEFKYYFVPPFYLCWICKDVSIIHSISLFIVTNEISSSVFSLATLSFYNSIPTTFTSCKQGRKHFLSSTSFGPESGWCQVKHWAGANNLMLWWLNTEEFQVRLQHQSSIGTSSVDKKVLRVTTRTYYSPVPAFGLPGFSLQLLHKNPVAWLQLEQRSGCC